jgi:hypothetical protein
MACNRDTFIFTFTFTVCDKDATELCCSLALRYGRRVVAHEIFSWIGGGGKFKYPYPCLNHIPNYNNKTLGSYILLHSPF